MDTPADTMDSNNNEDISLLTWMIKIQKEIIDQLTSDKIVKEVEFKMQNDLMAIELTSVREKLERLKRRFEELEDNSPNLSGLPEENEPVNKQQEKASEEINDPQLAIDCEHCPAATFDRENENYETTSELNDTFDTVEKTDTNSYGKSAIADVAVQRAAEADEVQQAKQNGKYVYRKQNKTDKLDVKLTSTLIRALQELCNLRRWPLPKYEFFQEDKTRHFFTTECTVLTFTVRVEGEKKKVGKNQAATLMYAKVKHVVTGNDDELSENDSVSFRRQTRGDAHADEFQEKPDTTDVVDVLAQNLNNDSEFENTLSEHVVDANRPVSTAEHETDDGPNEPIVAVYEGDRPLFGSVDRAAPDVVGFTEMLRLSSNPSVRALKEISPTTTVPSSTELLHRIAEEEGLTLVYDVHDTRALPIENCFNAVQITIVPHALTVVGCGVTVHDGREDAVHECLTRFKSILEEQLVV